MKPEAIELPVDSEPDFFLVREAVEEAREWAIVHDAGTYWNCSMSSWMGDAMRAGVITRAGYDAASQYHGRSFAYAGD